MAGIRFAVHLDTSSPRSVEEFQETISRTIRHHISAAVDRLGVTAQAMQELLQAVGGGGSPPARPLVAITPPEVEVREGPGRGDCAICLDSLEAGQGCCRPPCLHAFHGSCLREWLRQSPTCPVCKLSLTAPTRRESRELRFRLPELAGLTARELRYVASYLGIAVERGAERLELELTVLGSPSVRIVACHEELLALAVGRLQALLRSVGAERTAGLAEKADLVGALFGSGRFLQGGMGASTAPTPVFGTGNASSSASPQLAGSSFEPVRAREGGQQCRSAPY